MRTGITISLTSEDRGRLAAIVGDRDAVQKHVWRAAIILFSADGLLRDKTRPSRIPPLGPEAASAWLSSSNATRRMRRPVGRRR